MTVERWSRLRDLLDRALEAPAERSALIADLRSEDPTLSRELDSLLAEHDVEPEDLEPLAADPAGQRIGPYELIREIGRGGTGTVFLAVRWEDDIRMPVALKLLRQSFFDESTRRTFRRERQMLVRLDHPNIARLIDWSAASGGLFYLVIEYVEGEPLLDYCANRGLGLHARLALFADICAAVRTRTSIWSFIAI